MNYNDSTRRWTPSYVWTSSTIDISIYHKPQLTYSCKPTLPSMGHDLVGQNQRKKTFDTASPVILKKVSDMFEEFEICSQFSQLHTQTHHVTRNIGYSMGIITSMTCRLSMVHQHCKNRPSCSLTWLVITPWLPHWARWFRYAAWRRNGVRDPHLLPSFLVSIPRFWHIPLVLTLYHHTSPATTTRWFPSLFAKLVYN